MTSGDKTLTVQVGSRLASLDDIRTRFIRNDYLPHEYGWELLTYERVFDGGELPKTQLDWPGDMRADVVNDLRKREKVAAQVNGAAAE